MACKTIPERPRALLGEASQAMLVLPAGLFRYRLRDLKSCSTCLVQVGLSKASLTKVIGGTGVSGCAPLGFCCFSAGTLWFQVMAVAHGEGSPARHSSLGFGLR